MESNRFVFIVVFVALALPALALGAYTRFRSPLKHARMSS